MNVVIVCYDLYDMLKKEGEAANAEDLLLIVQTRIRNK